ncbi:MAG: transposase IS4 family protein [Stygiobacter sp.]|nr:MAG: transposase IS4 family protein [Stygiobacter sp.]
MWTAENRSRYDRRGQRYPSDLTNEEWVLLEPMLPVAKGNGCPRKYVLREVMNGIRYVQRYGMAEQYIKEGKNAVKWTRLSCRTMKADAARLQLHALAYNLSNFLCILALPEEMESWSLTTIRDRVVKTGAKVIAHTLCRLPDGRGGGAA